MKKVIFLILGILTVGILYSFAAGAAYEKTQPGVFEVKTLPAGKLLEAKMEEGAYFDSSNTLFRPLFRYISNNSISMTVPVEAKMDPGAMYFWVDPSEEEKAASDTSNVAVLEVPERVVASLGYRGRYTESNYMEVKAALVERLNNRDDLKMIGEPYCVFWNSPMMPGFLKTFEVQVEIEQIAAKSVAP
ncbi:MAG: heme-binding protein [Verrucomicrobiota bacterium]